DISAYGRMSFLRQCLKQRPFRGVAPDATETLDRRRTDNPIRIVEGSDQRRNVSRSSDLPQLLGSVVTSQVQTVEKSHPSRDPSQGPTEREEPERGAVSDVRR